MRDVQLEPKQMTAFMNKDDAATLARALNRRRFGFFGWIADLYRALTPSADKQFQAGAEKRSTP